VVAQAKLIMQRISEIQVVILAGGKGERLKPVVFDKPKVLAEISSRPFLTYVLDQVSLAGFKEVVLCTGYEAQQIKEKLGDTYGPLRLLYYTEKEPMGTGGALRLALSYLWSDIILITNGDSYMDIDLGSFVDWFFHKNCDAALVLTEVLDTARYGRVVIDEDENIITFDEKGIDMGPGWINAGIYLMKKSIIASIPTGRPYSLEREFFPSLAGRKLLGFRSAGRFIDIGTPASYTAAEEFFAILKTLPNKSFDRTQDRFGG
jgi:NDP-sugar pyrophosphorylase family protein